MGKPDVYFIISVRYRQYNRICLNGRFRILNGHSGYAGSPFLFLKKKWNLSAGASVMYNETTFERRFI